MTNPKCKVEVELVRNFILVRMRFFGVGFMHSILVGERIFQIIVNNYC
jgi:hypothetical protein